MLRIPADCDVVFVADMFSEDYTGGAELTTEALIASSPMRVFKIHSKDVTMDRLQEGVDKYWIFGNFAALDRNLIPSIVANMKYSVLEYDYKYCRYRSPEKHRAVEGSDCNCHQELNGKMVSAFYYQARSLWWMSERQLNRYVSVFPFLEDKNNTVLSSVFDEKFFATVKILRAATLSAERKGWVYCGGSSWIKGVEDAEDWCKSQGVEHEALWGLSYDKVLERLSKSEGFVFLPKGGDTCPRMVIEAKLLGCKLHVNDNVEHAKELWFDTDDLVETESYLYMARSRFWEGIKHDMEYRPTLSGYTTTRDCISQGYPYEASIASMLDFCDQVVVVDGGSKDGTWERLQEWSATEPKLTVSQVSVDWSDSRFAVQDGAQKARARDLCTQDFCWQQDSDEVVHQDDHDKIKSLLRNFPSGVKIISLPVVEYWGGTDKVRMDIFPWKWRLSRNEPDITHGIPAHLRKVDEDGKTYASPGTDGCDYISRSTGQVVPHASFYTQDVEILRRSAFSDPNALRTYESWFVGMVRELPSVHHYSWFDLGRKIRTYRDYWSKHWQSLYNIRQDDTAENNMFFMRPWKDVTEDDIDSLAKTLAEKMGGWVFHAPLDLTKPTPHLRAVSGHPKYMSEWLKRRS